jgi:tetratricopeptide (TPR) repeat protein
MSDQENLTAEQQDEQLASGPLGNLRVIDFNSLSGDQPGPRSGLGGWGLPIGKEHMDFDPRIGSILGYSLEKISIGFNQLRGMSQEKEGLNLSLNVPLGQGASMSQQAERSSKKQAEARAALDEALAGGIDAIYTFVIDENNSLHKHLAHEDQVRLAETLGGFDNARERNVALLDLLRRSTDAKDFSALLEAAGGKDKLNADFNHADEGVLQALLERHGEVDWNPPFFHSLFRDTDVAEGELTQEQITASAEGLRTSLSTDAVALLPEQVLEAFLAGEITASTIMGLSPEEVFMIAERGYTMMAQGRLDSALRIFDGLAYLNPYEPYFYTVLGSICQQKDDVQRAMDCYNIAIRLQPYNINALANRGELYFNQNMLAEAMQDFSAVVQFDPEGQNESTVRVGVLLRALRDAFEKQQAGEGTEESDSAE